MFRVNCDPIPKTADKRRDVESECNCRLKRRALASHNDDVPEMCMSNEGNESMYLEHNSFQQVFHSVQKNKVA